MKNSVWQSFEINTFGISEELWGNFIKWVRKYIMIIKPHTLTFHIFDSIEEKITPKQVGKVYRQTYKSGRDKIPFYAKIDELVDNQDYKKMSVSWRIDYLFDAKATYELERIGDKTKLTYTSQAKPLVLSARLATVDWIRKKHMKKYYQTCLFEDAQYDEPGMNMQEVQNYIAALDFGLKRLLDLPLSLRLIKEIHEQLMQGVRGSYATPGEFRKTQNWIGPPGCSLNTAKFVPPPTDHLIE